MSRLYDIDRAKVENCICPYCDSSLLKGSWDVPLFLDSTLELFCNKCKLKFVITSGFFGRGVEQYKLG